MTIPDLPELFAGTTYFRRATVLVSSMACITLSTGVVTWTETTPAVPLPAPNRRVACTAQDTRTVGTHADLLLVRPLLRRPFLLIPLHSPCRAL